MADTKVSALSAVAAVAGANEIPVNEAGTSKKASVTQLASFLGNTLYNQSTADQTINAATTTYLTNSNISVPVGKLRIGTRFIWRITLSKTAAGTAGNIFIVKLGTLGTTGDTSVLTFTLPTATGVADVGFIEIVVTVRGPLSASGVLQGHLVMVHNLQTTGLANIPGVALNVTSGVFDVTTANLIAGIVCTTAASTVLTFQQVCAEAVNL